jgi:hypothetical protein
MSLSWTTALECLSGTAQLFPKAEIGVLATVAPILWLASSPNILHEMPRIGLSEDSVGLMLDCKIFPHSRSAMDFIFRRADGALSCEPGTSSVGCLSCQKPHWVSVRSSSELLSPEGTEHTEMQHTKTQDLSRRLACFSKFRIQDKFRKIHEVSKAMNI